MTVVLGRTTLPDKYHWRRSSIGRSSGMYLIRLDSASIWTRQERRREGNSQQGRGNLCFRRKWDLRDSYSHPPLPILPPPERFLEPLRSAYGRFPNRAIYRPLSRGWECKSYLYCISPGQVNISSSHHVSCETCSLKIIEIHLLNYPRFPLFPAASSLTHAPSLSTFRSLSNI